MDQARAREKRVRLTSPHTRSSAPVRLVCPGVVAYDPRWRSAGCRPASASSANCESGTAITWTRPHTSSGCSGKASTTSCRALRRQVPRHRRADPPRRRRVQPRHPQHHRLRHRRRLSGQTDTSGRARILKSTVTRSEAPVARRPRPGAASCGGKHDSLRFPGSSPLPSATGSRWSICNRRDEAMRMRYSG